VDRGRWLVLGGSALVGLAALAGGGVWFARGLPARVERLVRTQVEASVDADVAWGSVRLTGLSALPRVGLEVRDLVVTGRDAFAGVELARLDRVGFAVDPWAVVGSTVRVRSVTVEGGRVDLRVDRQGRANWDVVREGDDSGGEGLALSLDDVVVRDLGIDWLDQQGRTEVHVADLDVDGAASWTGSVAGTKAHATISSLDLRSGRTRWLADTRWVIDADAAWDSVTGGLTFGDTKLAINDLPLSLAGSLVPAGDDWSTDLKFAAEDTTFGPLLSLVPNAYQGSMAGVKTSGSVAFGGSVKGRYSSAADVWPTFDVSLDVKDAAFAYPSLPSEVRDLAVKARVTHEEGPSASTALALETLRFSTGGAPFEAHGTVARMFGNPLVDLAAKGTVDLGALGTALPVPEGTEVPGGVLEVDVAFAGAQSDFEAPNPDRIQARGEVRGRKIRFVTTSMPDPVVVDDLSVGFTPRTAELRSAQVTFGDSDLSASGSLDNLVGYALGGDVLTGDLALGSKHLDLRPFQGRDTEAGTTTDEGLLVAVPMDLDLRVTSAFREVVTRRVELTDVGGLLTVRGGVVRMEDLRAGMLGGRVVMSGSYAAPTAEAADLDLAVDAVSLDIGRTATTFLTLQRMAPVLERMSGRFDSGFSMRTRLAKDGTPDLKITQSAGKLAPTGSVKAPSLKAAEQKLGPAAGAGLGAVEFAGNVLQYVLKQGVLDLAPVDVSLGSLGARMQGTADVAARTLDLAFTAEVPVGQLLELVGAKAGKGKQDVVVRLQGTFDDPKVSVALGDGGGVPGVASDALRARADQILDEAKAAANRLIEEADAKAKRLVQKADGPAEKVAAEAAAKVVKDQARKAADRVLDEARKKADALLQSEGGGAGGKPEKRGKQGKKKGG